MLHKMIVKDFF